MAGESTHRLFIAVELPEELKRSLGRLRTLHPDLERELRWVRSESIHITLRFLGSATAEQREALVTGLTGLSFGGEFALECRGVGMFGGAARPRVLWAGVTGETQKLASVHGSVEAMCARLGWPEEEREFKPHITLARPRGRGLFTARASLEDLLSRYADTDFGGFTAREVTLYSSRLGPGGSVYTPVTRVSFHNREAPD